MKKSVIVFLVLAGLSGAAQAGEVQKTLSIQDQIALVETQIEQINQKLDDLSDSDIDRNCWCQKLVLAKIGMFH